MAPHTTRLNARSAVNHFGGAANLERLAIQHGVEPAPAYETIKKWRQRGSIPAAHLAAMTTLGDLLGKPFRLAEHMATPTTTHHGDE